MFSSLLVVFSVHDVGIATDQSFDSHWRFFRGDSPPSLRPTLAAAQACSSAFCEPGLDDSSWRQLDVPHDWSIEDLPPREVDRSAPVLAPRYGTWAFNKGDDSSWSHAAFDDSGWQRVVGGHDWRTASNYTDKNARGWYRQRVDANALFQSSPLLTLSLGVIAGSDETWVNGMRVGGTGNLDRPACSDYTAWRKYPVPPGLLKPTGNVVAVRVSSLGGSGTFGDGSYPGGLYDDPRVEDMDARRGPFDAGASLNGRSYGYTVGGIGWYRKEFTVPASASASASASAPVVARVRFDGVYMNSDVYLNGQLLVGCMQAPHARTRQAYPWPCLHHHHHPHPHLRLRAWASGAPAGKPPIWLYVV